VTANKIPPEYRGLHVTAVDAAGPAFQKLGTTDIIVRIIRPEPATFIKTAADLQRVVGKMKTGDYISLLVYNVQQAGTRVVNLKIGE